MQRAETGRIIREPRIEWVRLRTLVLLRWMAVTGQLAAIATAYFGFELALDLMLCLVAVGASVLANVVAQRFAPANKRLSETEAMLTLLFDLSQLAFLLYLTGGITNPFALLLLAPVTISATALKLRSTILLGLTAIALITLLTFFNMPLRLQSGDILSIPPLIEFGFWLAVVVGIIFMGFYSRRVAIEIQDMSEALFATQMALAREQKLTDLGGVVAAAAHELGTPLATIKLVSTEMADELADRPDLREDAGLITAQADRCRDILRSMGRAGKDDLQLHRTPLSELLRQAAEPHSGRGKEIRFELAARDGADAREPTVLRRPEIVHGLRNLIQNAVDFARTTVWISANWDAAQLTIRVGDDGPGFPPPLLGRIGDPFVRVRSDRARASTPAHRPGYEGMGLGLFIAKTLLKRTGATIRFANANTGETDHNHAGMPQEAPSGAIVTLTWSRERISPDSADALGENRPIEL